MGIILGEELEKYIQDILQETANHADELLEKYSYKEKKKEPSQTDLLLAILQQIRQAKADALLEKEIAENADDVTAKMQRIAQQTYGQTTFPTEDIELLAEMEMSEEMEQRINALYRDDVLYASKCK